MVERYDPDGKLAQVLKLPVPRVTSLAFGGAALDLLCITTARLGLSEAQVREAPLSGGDWGELARKLLHNDMVSRYERALAVFGAAILDQPFPKVRQRRVAAAISLERQ